MSGVYGIKHLKPWAPATYQIKVEGVLTKAGLIGLGECGSR